MNEPQTVWRIVALEGWGRLDVRLVVDTTAQSVVSAIERAAERNGIELKRVPPPRCYHDGWVEGCPRCEFEHALAIEQLPEDPT